MIKKNVSPAGFQHWAHASVLAGFNLLVFVAGSAASTLTCPASETVFAERDGVVAVEAEHFSLQRADSVRAFYKTTEAKTPNVKPDGDPNHVAGASGGCYLEILPDTRRTHDDKLIRAENFSDAPGKLAVLEYQVHFTNPGRYYVWARAHSTGSEDNGLHVGIDGTWPASGQRMQWCDGKQQWWWESKQRTKEEHCGEPFKIYLDVDSPGVHTIQFSMREDGFEFDKWMMTRDRLSERPNGVGPEPVLHSGAMPAPLPFVPVAKQSESKPAPTEDAGPLQPRGEDGTGASVLTGEPKLWHTLTLEIDGPFAHEQDTAPNPFTDYNLTVTWIHASGAKYAVPGYFAADGNAANSSAASGTQWHCKFVPDQIGEWKYEISFTQGKLAALDPSAKSAPVKPADGATGTVTIMASDKTGRDLRSEGRLAVVGAPYLQFLGSKRYFLKAGADAPETLLGYTDFDGTVAGKPGKVPLKTFEPHLQDWMTGDPTWQNEKGKGLIGAVNYLSGKGCNAFSFLTYNAGGDGDNVWPFIARDKKLHYDCSKLAQWGIVFDHGTQRGMYLHFKLQETENDDNRGGKGKGKTIPESLDGGELGIERKLYVRELIARFGHNLALNWNLGEENTQSTQQQQDMIDYIAALDPYGHPIVLHTYPDQQDKVYGPLLGEKSQLDGVSLQNSSIKDTHSQTVKWRKISAESGKPWIVAFDESGSAAHGQCPDLGYRGFDGTDKDGKMIYTENEVRKQTLWGTLLGGGAGVEYYFGYKFAENDLVAEDWRSRDRSWDYCRIAINFFQDEQIPFWEMVNMDELVGNEDHKNNRYCFAKAGSDYLVYLPDGGTSDLDLTNAKGDFQVQWFNPRTGGSLVDGSVGEVTGGSTVSLGVPPMDDFAGQSDGGSNAASQIDAATKAATQQSPADWLAVIRKK